ncbi:hypothetical protein [Marisediminicola antarctica]|uniref:Ribosomally synthesized peptide with SipW-like signal peptide n=1 Tax=Marisediminicola antarctica TaxID=674079 RepID=A0A7L5AKN9_9MICO|nr:hypothetical protein [Marisediminicola antarctica]QHO70642.1 hypothetical protein BHD05_14275 [Marisediminicola antarctica]
MNAESTSAPRSRPSVLRRMLSAAAAIAVATFLALLGTGTSYALWNGEAVVDASSVSSGNVGLTINGAAAYALTGLDAERLAPGRSQAASLAIANTGTTRLSVTVSGTEVLAQSNSLAGFLTASLVPAADCAVATFVPAPLAGFTTTAAPVVLEPGETRQFCLAISLNAAAPPAAQGGGATFAMAINAVQVR